MENAQLIGLSRQDALRRQLDVIANNLANMNTAGFKSEGLLFQEFLNPAALAAGFSGDDRQLSFVRDGEPMNDYTPGSITPTGNPLDLAINGDGWFAVETPDGEAFTRNGVFTLDPTGQLVTGEGMPVLGEAGPLAFGAGETAIEIAADGTVSSSIGRKGKIRIVTFEDNRPMERIGASLFSGEDPVPAAGARVVQGAVEGSNVRAVLEIARMVEVTRAYSSVSKTMADTAELGNTAVNQLGRLDA